MTSASDKTYIDVFQKNSAGFRIGVLTVMQTNKFVLLLQYSVAQLFRFNFQVSICIIAEILLPF